MQHMRHFIHTCQQQVQVQSAEHIGAVQPAFAPWNRNEIAALLDRMEGGLKTPAGSQTHFFIAFIAGAAGAAAFAFMAFFIAFMAFIAFIAAMLRVK